MTYKYLRLHLSSRSRSRSRFASFLSPTFQFKNLLLLGVLCCFLKVTGCEGYVHAYDLKIYIHDHAHAHAQAHGRVFKASSTYKHLSSSITSTNNNASKSKSTSCSLHATCKSIHSTLVRRGSARMTRRELGTIERRLDSCGHNYRPVGGLNKGFQSIIKASLY